MDPIPNLMFCNTVHFIVNGSVDVVRSTGGLHRFIGRPNAPLITDSGGFQIHSWKSRGLVDSINTETGFAYRSYRDGTKHVLSPEGSIDAQIALGADIALVLDELLGFHEIGREATLKSMERSHVWAVRCLLHHEKVMRDMKERHNETTPPPKQALYGIVHGGFQPDLRQQSSAFLSQLHFDGYAVGGSLGIGDQTAAEALEAALYHLPPTKPRHLLGLGDWNALKLGIKVGFDTFDSSYPTKLARHGEALIDDQSENLHLRQSRFAHEVNQIIDETCECFTCTQRYSRAFLHHLWKCHEPVFGTLVSLHNLYAVNRFFERVRKNINNGEL